MIFQVEISNQADTDLRSIYEYIAFELQSPDNAIGQLNRLEASIMGLEQMRSVFINMITSLGAAEGFES